MKTKRRTHPNAELAVEGAEVGLLVEETRRYVLHEDVRIVNRKGAAFRDPVIVCSQIIMQQSVKRCRAQRVPQQRDCAGK